jgi:GalNAc-alpha-(1->4)-GalNAc-alpha-(1->3)-diNAcBac-PP-undecaprenol alpha-1,4-N-acetyl-D-galactosaminyltransferase
MKIDFIISALHGGGAERVLTLLANNFSKNKDYDITVITLFDTESKYELDINVRVILLGV